MSTSKIVAAVVFVAMVGAAMAFWNRAAARSAAVAKGLGLA